MWAQRFLHETGQGERGPRRGRRRPAPVRRAATSGPSGASRSTWRPTSPPPYVVEPVPCRRLHRRRSTARARSSSARSMRARDLPHPPAVIAVGAYRAGARPGLDIGDHLLWDDYTRNYTSFLRDELFATAGLAPGRRRPRRDLRLLHQHGADGPRGARAVRARRRRASSSRSGSDGDRRHAARSTPTAACWPRATCTG